MCTTTLTTKKSHPDSKFITRVKHPGLFSILDCVPIQLYTELYIHIALEARSFEL